MLAYLKRSFMQEGFPMQNSALIPVIKASTPGGPLVWTSPAGRMVLIGTVQGAGFNCKCDLDPSKDILKSQKLSTWSLTVSWRSSLIENTCFKGPESLATLKAPMMAFGTRWAKTKNHKTWKFLCLILVLPESVEHHKIPTKQAPKGCAS